jgi:alpha 1,3-glucosidase
MISYDPLVYGNVGLYWINAADTWIDIYKSQTNKLKRGTYWISESGVLEFLLILGSSPKSILEKWSDISGHAPMPPYFSLGYHQSKWGNLKAHEIIEISQNFDKYDLPVDTFWLDIEVTNHMNHFNICIAYLR